MPRRRSTTVTLAEWPPPIRHVIHAAELECPPGHAAALLELMSLAIRKIPSRGILDPTARGEQDVFAAVEAAARSHLELAQARRAWRESLDAADLTLERRDAIERAALETQGVSDTAYFYAGLAFGLVAACVYRTA